MTTQRQRKNRGGGPRSAGNGSGGRPRPTPGSRPVPAPPAPQPTNPVTPAYGVDAAAVRRSIITNGVDYPVGLGGLLNEVAQESDGEFYSGYGPGNNSESPQLQSWWTPKRTLWGCVLAVLAVGWFSAILAVNMLESTGASIMFAELMALLSIAAVWLTSRTTKKEESPASTQEPAPAQEEGEPNA